MYNVTKNCFERERTEKATVITKKRYFSLFKKENFGREMSFLSFRYRNYEKNYSSFKNTMVFEKIRTISYKCY